MILIVSIRDDLHAMTIRDTLAKKGYTDCHILECDHISTDHRVYWRNTKRDNQAVITLNNSTIINLESVELIWWRRVRADQNPAHTNSNDHQARLINNDCRGALNGILESNFKGKWISEPVATDRASNKIYQLSVAEACGFRIPQTLISQSLEEVKQFVKELKGNVIVKPVVGAAGPLMFTEFIGDPTRLDPMSYQVCPAVYQEYIEGTQHIRLNCFGNASYAATIESDDLDWRPNLNVPVRPFDVPPSLHQKVRCVLDHLGLEIGIIDIKQTPQGEFVWLEVNPQGQFLFLEPLTKIPLASYFADYLLESLPN